MAYYEPRLRKRGNKYQIDYVSTDGRRRRLSVGRDYRVAERIRIKYANWLLDGKDPEREEERERSTRQKRSIGLKEFFPIFMERYGSKQSENMQISYYNSFKNICRCPELAEIPIGDIARGLMIDYMNARTIQHGVSTRTVDIEKAFVSVMLTCAAEWGNLEANPLLGMKRFDKAQKRDVSLSCEQVEALITVLAKPQSDIVEIALLSGMRKGNILNLRIEQIEFHSLWQMAMVRTVVKGGREETIPIGPEAVDTLRRVIRGKTDGYVFPNPRTGKPYVSIHKTVDKTIRQLGLNAVDGSKLRFHDLRHYRASTLLNAGASLEDVQVALGHTSRLTTERYITHDKTAAGERLSLIKSPGRYHLPGLRSRV
ncbi:tyrosine-type recombinase/integrase [Gemmatimonadota bacterium]